MKDESQEKDKKMHIAKVVGLAVGLPSSILGVFAFVYILTKKNIISETTGLFLILAIFLGSSLQLSLTVITPPLSE